MAEYSLVGGRPKRMRGIRSSAEEAWLSSITETLRTWRYVMRETYETRNHMLGWRFCLGNPDDKIPAWPHVHCGFIWTSRC